MVSKTQKIVKKHKKPTKCNIENFYTLLMIFLSHSGLINKVGLSQ